jgi:uncharacterized protein (TIGR03067 family)
LAPTEAGDMIDAQTLLDGTWQMIRAELDGMKAPDFVTGKIEIRLGAGVYAVSFDGEVVDRGSYALSVAANAKIMVLRGESGPNAGRTIPGLYQVVGDRLRVCYGLDGTLPTGFATAGEHQRYLVTYRRKVA